MKTSKPITGIDTWTCCGQLLAANAVCRKCGGIKSPGTGQNHAVAAFNGQLPVSFTGVQAKTPGKGKKPLLNKTEERFRREWPCGYPKEGLVICWQTYRMPFPDGGEYRPDCVVLRQGYEILPTELPPPGSVIIEIKGGYRGPGWEQGYERFKRARLQWPQYEWHCFESKKGKFSEIMRVEK